MITGSNIERLLKLIYIIDKTQMKCYNKVRCTTRCILNNSDAQMCRRTTMGKDFWNGSYETSREGQQSLEQDILDAGVGKFAYPVGDGTVKETPNSINVYFPDSNSPDGHSHDGVNKYGQRYTK